MLHERCSVLGRFVIFLLFSALIVASPAMACPATLFNNELSPNFTGLRVNIKMYAWSDETAADKPAGWRTIPYQVDPIDSDGFLMFFKDDAYTRAPVGKDDVFIFNPEAFGKQVDLRKNPLPCKSSSVFQLYDLVGKRFAYLASCDGPQSPEVFPFQVSFNDKENFLESGSYRYRFNENNYMLFKDISFRDQAGNLRSVAWDSEMLIKADAKRFFTMRFDSQDIVSRLEESRRGPVANLARVSFFLKILFFKIRMSLNTDVAFFRESGHIPMMINIPVEANHYLNAKSGILYSWVKSPAALFKSSPQDIPVIDPGLIAQGHKRLGEYGLKFCRGSDCRFRYHMEVDGKLLSMDLGIKKELVQRGFFPMYVPDVASFQKDMDWSEKYLNAKDRTGLYFEVSGLEKGGHPWDFWLRLGGNSSDYKRCPATVFISKPKI